MIVTLRSATTNDLPYLRQWDNDPDVLASDPNDDWNWDEEITRTPSWRHQLIIEADEHPVGFIQIINAVEEETHYWGEQAPGTYAIDIWIGVASARRRGIGSMAMKMAIEKCFQDLGATRIVIDPLISNDKAIAFYRRFGFRDVEFRTFGEDECLVMELRKDGRANEGAGDL